MSSLRLFCLVRHEDETGISGTGKIAEGVIFPGGQALLYWLTHHNSIGIYPSLDELVAIHGHGGKTEVVLY